MYAFVKRCIDVLLSFVALLLFTPVGLVVSAILLMTGERQVFFLQKRIGRGQRVFRVVKFVTMVKNAESIGTGDITVRGDTRVLPFGRMLRKTKLNEVPQLLNVLVGQMSIIGPRPLTPGGFECYSERDRRVVASLKPGLSGVGSVVFRDEESIVASSEGPARDVYRTRIMPFKGKLEGWYAEHRSFRLDMLLALLTIWVVVFPQSRRHLRFLRGLPTT